MKFNIIFILVLISTVVGVYLYLNTDSSTAVKYCSTVYDDWTQEEVSFDQSTARLSTLARPVTIPVVVHVLYNTEIENISDYQIHSQLKVLNEDFSGSNADISNTPSEFSDIIAGDSKIRFKLAELDPQGNPTSGICRYKTNVVTFTEEQRMKNPTRGGAGAWPSHQYLNLWVCNLGGVLLGFAQYPSQEPSTDGVVLDYRAVGKKAKLNKEPFTLGRTATHEVGHWLGLQHIWGDGSCNRDDGIDDTPLAASNGSGCVYRNECGSLNMNNNFMDYGDDACLTAFTKGQANKMQSLFFKGGAREQLKVSPALTTNVITNTKPVVASSNSSGVYVPDLVIKQHSSSYILSWSRIPAVDFYSIKVRLPNKSWKYYDIPKEALSASLNNLDACTTYDIQVIGVEGVKSLKGKSATHNIQTSHCDSNIPANFTIVDKKKGKIEFTWTPTHAKEYEIQWREYGSKKVIIKKVKNTRISIKIPKKDQVYQIRVRSLLPSGNSSPFSKVLAYKF